MRVLRKEVKMIETEIVCREAAECGRGETELGVLVGKRWGLLVRLKRGCGDKRGRDWE